MPRIVLKCPYLKGGAKNTAAHLSNLVTYMATRCGVEKLPKERSSFPSTLKQEDLIQQIINEFPEAQKLFEYEDYIENKTVENASEFITMALEQNMDKIGQRENYVDYIANRPRVQRMGVHGLFTGGDPLPENSGMNAIDFTVVAETSLAPVYRFTDPDPLYFGLWNGIKRVGVALDKALQPVSDKYALTASLVLTVLVFILVWLR